MVSRASARLCSDCAGIVCSPWIHLPRRFSLRTLLIATTLIAVGLGLIVVLNSGGFFKRGAI